MNFNPISEDIALILKKIVGEAYFFSEYEIRWSYTFGGSIFEKDWVPDLVLLPQKTKQISQLLKVANNNLIPVVARGSGTSLASGSLATYGGIVIDLSLMKKTKIDIVNNLVEVEPGVICDELNEKLSKHGYFFPPDPGSSSVATVGGMVATNAGGVQAFKYGVTKDYVLYLECVLSDGRIVQLGSKTLKSVSSYNIKDLIVGSEGTLCVITKIGLRIKPLPIKRKLGVYIYDNIENLGQAVIQLRKEGIVPIMLEFLDKLASQAVFEYLGGEFSLYPNGYILLADLDGFEYLEIENRFNRLHETLMKYDPTFNRIAANDNEREAFIQARKAALPALSRIGPSCCIEDCTVQMSDFISIINKIEQITIDLNIPNIKIATFGHMEGNLHPTFIFNENNDSDVKDFEKAVDYLYTEIITPIGGTITGEHGIGKVKTPYMELEYGSEVIDLQQRLKRLFDPNGILNPGCGKGSSVVPRKIYPIRYLKNQSDKLLELNCMRCGFCTRTCPSLVHYKTEAYSPRGRLSVLNGLVFGDLSPNKLINDIFHTCTLCALCVSKCPAGIPISEIFEKAREILHKVNEGN